MGQGFCRMIVVVTDDTDLAELLAAFSQASMIHVRSSPRAPVDRSRFNEAYMMHGSTSPLYALTGGSS